MRYLVILLLILAGCGGGSNVSKPGVTSPGIGKTPNPTTCSTVSFRKVEPPIATKVDKETFAAIPASTAEAITYAYTISNTSPSGSSTSEIPGFTTAIDAALSYAMNERISCVTASSDFTNFVNENVDCAEFMKSYMAKISNIGGCFISNPVLTPISENTELGTFCAPTGLGAIVALNIINRTLTNSCMGNSN